MIKERVMRTKWIIAIIPTELLESLERQLATAHAPGLTITKVKGYGEYKNFFSSDLT
ncbi:P-II family nitrogen regulator, partial [Klebsiella pneumoniae]|uniref:P-II family nitrogen regulator n=1 Tax=Klebsiella pneumoniae TaxID=573 RepID=UPI003F7F79C3